MHGGVSAVTVGDRTFSLFFFLAASCTASIFRGHAHGKHQRCGYEGVGGAGAPWKRPLNTHPRTTLAPSCRQSTAFSLPLLAVVSGVKHCRASQRHTNTQPGVGTAFNTLIVPRAPHSLHARSRDRAQLATLPDLSARPRPTTKRGRLLKTTLRAMHWNSRAGAHIARAKGI
jgi:hypothetical protein